MGSARMCGWLRADRHARGCGREGGFDAGSARAASVGERREEDEERRTPDTPVGAWGETEWWVAVRSGSEDGHRDLWP